MRKLRFLIGLGLLLTVLAQSVAAAQLLIPGGQVIGLELKDDQVTVAAFDEGMGADARTAGLKVGDRILQVDGKPVTSVREVREALSRSQGQVNLQILREGQTRELTILPQITAAGPRLGVYLKEGITGVGTVTWYDPQEKTIGALGHGVHDPAGSLLTITGGTAYKAWVVSVKKGTVGTPGQLMGTMNSRDALGRIYKNAPQGIFVEADQAFSGEPLPVGAWNEIRTGAAVIRSTVDHGPVQEYSVEILKIYPESRADGRNLLLRITDPALLEATGGIVQGMSGSPIIQDGKLVGAVTHVLVNQPDTGYGIFIENMLDAAA